MDSCSSLSLLWAMRDQVLGVGDHDGCRLRGHFLPALRLHFANERRVDGGRVRAVAFGPRLGGRVQLPEERGRLILPDRADRKEIVDVSNNTLRGYDDGERNRVRSGIVHVVQ